MDSKQYTKFVRNSERNMRLASMSRRPGEEWNAYLGRLASMSDRGKEATN